MSYAELIDAVSKKTGEDSCEVRRHGFSLAGPDDARPDHDPDCPFDLIDLPESGTVDWDALLYGCREPFFTRTLKARKKKRVKKTATSTVTKVAANKQVARAA
jgi:hypothetical protein